MTISPRHQQALRLEMLRAQAALERQQLAHNAKELGNSLRPSALLQGLVPQLAAAGGGSWLLRGLVLTRRHPWIISGVSALFARRGTRRGKHRNWLRLGAGLLLGWQLVRSVKARSAEIHSR